MTGTVGLSGTKFFLDKLDPSLEGLSQIPVEPELPLDVLDGDLGETLEARVELVEEELRAGEPDRPGQVEGERRRDRDLDRRLDLPARGREPLEGAPRLAGERREELPVERDAPRLDRHLHEGVGRGFALRRELDSALERVAAVPARRPLDVAEGHDPVLAVEREAVDPDAVGEGVEGRRHALALALGLEALEGADLGLYVPQGALGREPVGDLAQLAREGAAHLGVHLDPRAARVELAVEDPLLLARVEDDRARDDARRDRARVHRRRDLDRDLGALRRGRARTLVRRHVDDAVRAEPVGEDVGRDRDPVERHPRAWPGHPLGVALLDGHVEVDLAAARLEGVHHAAHRLVELGEEGLRHEDVLPQHVDVEEVAVDDVRIDLGLASALEPALGQDLDVAALPERERALLGGEPDGVVGERRALPPVERGADRELRVLHEGTLEDHDLGRPRDALHLELVVDRAYVGRHGVAQGVVERDVGRVHEDVERDPLGVVSEEEGAARLGHASLALEAGRHVLPGDHRARADRDLEAARYVVDRVREAADLDRAVTDMEGDRDVRDRAWLSRLVEARLHSEVEGRVRVDDALGVELGPDHVLDVGREERAEERPDHDVLDVDRDRGAAVGAAVHLEVELLDELAVDEVGEPRDRRAAVRERARPLDEGARARVAGARDAPVGLDLELGLLADRERVGARVLVLEVDVHVFHVEVDRGRARRAGLAASRDEVLHVEVVALEADARREPAYAHVARGEPVGERERRLDAFHLEEVAAGPLLEELEALDDHAAAREVDLDVLDRRFLVREELAEDQAGARVELDRVAQQHQVVHPCEEEEDRRDDEDGDQQPTTHERTSLSGVTRDVRAGRAVGVDPARLLGAP